MSARALIALALGASSAHASPWEAAYAFGGGVDTIADETYTSGMLQIVVAREVAPRAAASVALELASLTADSGDSEIAGATMRGLAGLDLALLRLDERAFSPNLIGSLGAGAETIMWDRGTLTRALTYLSLEYRSGFRVDSDFFRNISSLGFRFGLRVRLAPGVATTTVAKLCTACEPSAPGSGGLDLGGELYMGLTFGR